MLDVQPLPLPPRAAAASTAASSAPLKHVNSGVLFEGAHELRIDHHGQEYRLRLTRNGKLILTK